MDGKHPKRKKEKYNPYTLSVENDTYYIAFTDGQGAYHKTQISKELYAAFNGFELEDISQMNAFSRHLEHSELTEETLSKRAMFPPEAMEDGVYRKIAYELLHNAINNLPDIQRRRVLLYYFEGYTYEQIAIMEGCSKRAIKFSVDNAVKNLRKKSKLFLKADYTFDG